MRQPFHRPERPRHTVTLHHGFTLIELLVVISIIALLLAILLPVLQSTRSAGDAVVCAASMRQHGIASMTYANDYTFALPTAHISFLRGDGQATTDEDSWPWLLMAGRYLTENDPKKLVCPEYIDVIGLSAWGWEPGLPISGTRITRSYSMVNLDARPDGSTPSDPAGHYQTPYAVYNIDAVTSPSDKLLISERNRLTPFQLPSTTVASGGRVNQIEFDATQWLGGHPHIDSANWAFYDGSVRRIAYPIVKADQKLWDFEF